MRSRSWFAANLVLLSVVASVPSWAADIPMKAKPIPAPIASGPKFWAEAEYLYWQTKGDALPALVTAGTAGGNGVLGAPGTSSCLAIQLSMSNGGRAGVYALAPGSIGGALRPIFLGLKTPRRVLARRQLERRFSPARFSMLR
jgi:hypothetical protein